MTRYLLPEQLPEILDRWYADPQLRERRIMGPEQIWDSGYFDIFRFFGASAIDPSRITLEYGPSLFRIPDSALARFAAQMAARMKSEGRLYDGPPVMKFASLTVNSAGFVMRVQPAGYADQAGTCFALDIPTEHFGSDYSTARAYVMHRYGPMMGQSNPLAICLGVCGIVILEEQETRYLVKVHRSGKLASLESSIGPSVAGSVDWTTQCRTVAELLHKSLAAELREELGVDPSQCRITPLAMATEILRGEKPQLFGLIECSMSRAELERCVDSIPSAGREHDRLEFLEWGQVNRPKSEKSAAFNFEARANIELAREMLRQV